MDNFPHAFEVAVVNSPRVLRGLAAVGLPAPEMVVVEAGDGAIALCCHDNVRTEVLLKGGQTVCGYSLIPSRSCQCVQFEAHSVIYRDGRLVDVTPDWQGERAKFFVREPAFMFEEYFDMVSIWDKPDQITPFVCILRDGKEANILGCGASCCACYPGSKAKLDKFINRQKVLQMLEK